MHQCQEILLQIGVRSLLSKTEVTGPVLTVILGQLKRESMGQPIKALLRRLLGHPNYW
jgi:hypothetical protein